MSGHDNHDSHGSHLDPESLQGPDSPQAMSRSALVWLIGAGGFAITLSVFLYVTDYRLSHSTRERDLHDRLLELRTAQASLKSKVTDDRLLVRDGALSSGSDSSSPTQSSSGH